MQMNQFIQTLVGADLSASVNIALSGLFSKCAQSAPYVVACGFIQHVVPIYRGPTAGGEMQGSTLKKVIHEVVCVDMFLSEAQ
jgi:hypothetical protein